MEGFLSNTGRTVLLALIRTIQQNKTFLSDIDGAIGDGDHGINMSKGFTLCEERLDEACEDISTAFKTLANVLLTEIGGSMGPIYGTFFNRLARGCAKKEKIDAVTFGEMLNSAAEGVMEIGGARPGDKTCLDCLVPAAKAYETVVISGGSFADALKSMMRAAEEGKDATKDMVAKVGRSSRLGERSRGVLDAGAASCNLILQSIGATFLQLLVEKS